MVGAAAKGHAGVKRHHQLVFGGDIVLPAGTHHQPLPQMGGMVKPLPGVGPVLLGQRPVGLHAVGDLFGFQPLGQKSGRFGGVLLRRQIEVQHRFGAAARQQLLIDQVDMGDFRNHLQHIAVIFNVDAIGDDQLRDGFGRFGVLGVYGYFQVSPVHGGSFLLWQSGRGKRAPVITDYYNGECEKSQPFLPAFCIAAE